MTIGQFGGVGTAGYGAGALGAAGPAGATATSNATGTSGAAKSHMASQLATPNLFLKLLMVELEHQNPTSPMTPASMLQQTAMLSQVEAITSMKSAVDQQQRSAAATEATGLIGKQVTALVGSKTVTGSVSDVFLSATGTPTLDVGGTKVPISSVTQVRAATTPTTALPGTTNAVPSSTPTTNATTGTTTA